MDTFLGPHNQGYSILGPMLGPRIFGNSQLGYPELSESIRLLQILWLSSCVICFAMENLNPAAFQDTEICV